MNLLNFSLGIITGLLAYHAFNLYRFGKKLKSFEDFAYREILDHQSRLSALESGLRLLVKD